ncbi:MAG: ABC transporter ATP-binding protein [Bacilli bacterium]
MFTVFTQLKWFFKEHWKRYTLAIILLNGVSFLGLLTPYLLGQSVDQIIAGTLSSDYYVTILWQLLFISLIIYVLGFLWQKGLFGGSFIVEKTLRSKLMRHFLKMGPQFYGNNRTGDLMAIGTNDLRAISMTTGYGMLTLVDSIFYTIMIVAMMGFSVSWKLTLFTLLPLPLLALLIQKYGQYIQQRYRIAQNAFGELNNVVLESVSAVRTIRSFVQEKNDVERFTARTKDVMEKNLRVSQISALVEPTVRFIVGLCYTIAFSYGAFLVFDGAITMGNLLSFSVYLGMLIWPMFAIGEMINIMNMGNASLERVNGTLSTEETFPNEATKKEVSEVQSIALRNFSFSYPGAENKALDNITTYIQKGQRIGIVGRTGSGKTTFVRQLLREYHHGETGMYVNDEPVDLYSVKSLRSHFGYVSQDHMLFSDSIANNLTFNDEECTEQQRKIALSAANVWDDIATFTDGMDTVIGERGVSLSGGQKQRLSIARALMAQKPLLIFDDALSAVDATTETKILESIATLEKDVTLILVAHRLSAVRNADNILVLDEGKIIAQGSHDTLLGSCAWYKEQWEVQQFVEKEEVH